MKEYQVSDLIGNEVLAKPVYLENGNIILEIGTVLKAGYKESLISLNVNKIFIEDSYEKYEDPNFYFKRNEFKEFIEELRKIISHHIYKENQRLRKLEELAENIVNIFENIEEKRVVDIRDRTSDLYEHSIYTTLFVLMLGKEYHFCHERMRNAALGCLLHDLGHQYLSVNYENWNEMNLVPLKLFELKRHKILGYTAVEREEWIPEISKNMILSHHEKLDGSGYPLKQRKYELECQMIQICDSFDCAVAGIGCKKQSICEALNMIVDSEKYVRNMALLLKEKIGIFPTGSLVRLNNQKDAIVISQTENPSAPIVLYNMEFDEGEPVPRNLNYLKNIEIVGKL